MKKILILSPRWPLPPVDGARVASVELWSILSQMGLSVEVLACVLDRPKDESQDRALSSLGLSALTRFPRVQKTQQILKKLLHPFWPYTVISLGQAEYKKQFIDRIAVGDIHAIVVDALHAAEIFLNDPELIQTLHSKKISIIYRAHNVEADIWKTKVHQSKGIKKLLFQFEAANIERAEKKLCNLSQQVWTVSDEDAEYFKQWGVQSAFHTIRISQPFPDSLQSVSTSAAVIRLGFLGSMDWGPNREGLIWFLDQVWPEVYEKRPDLEVVVAGSRANAELQSKLRSTPGLTFLGQVQSTAEFYRNVDLFLVPIFYGSGTRVKAIEASKEGVPCLSTALGVMGVGLTPKTSYIHAETAEDWKGALLRLPKTAAPLKEMGERAFLAAKNQFSRQSVQLCIQKALSEL